MQQFLLCGPFVGMILSIALGPLIAPHRWHRSYGVVSMFWAVLAMVVYDIYAQPDDLLHHIGHVMIHEYIPFIILIGSLFIITHSIHVHFDGYGTPVMNTLILGVGGVLANIFGTAGASLLLIRPLLAVNENRQHVVHTVIFFIFIVSNMGGVLTPLGDPPLFLGYLKGVSFFWPLIYLIYPFIFIILLLLFIYFFIDLRFYKRDIGYAGHLYANRYTFHMTGGAHLFFLGGVIGCILFSTWWTTSNHIMIGTIDYSFRAMARDGGIASMALLSYGMAKQRGMQRPDWSPLREVTQLFLGIFITLIPVIDVLHHQTAAFGDHLSPLGYFWLSGLLSGFLDNAPTYVVFFHMAGGDAHHLMYDKTSVLMAISMGTVFMGALSYIGNAPNFMVRSIAQARGVPMPGFFGYMVWSCAILLPLFAVIGWLFLGV